MKRTSLLFSRSTNILFRLAARLVITTIIIFILKPGILSAQIFTKLTDPKFNSESAGCGWADYNKDGNLDAYLTFFNVGNRLYSNNGITKFDLISSGDAIPSGNNFSGIAWGDYDNDGNIDLYVTSMNGTNSLLRNLGDGHFERILNSATTKDGGSFLSCNWVDYDNDGNLDLFVTASGTGFTPGSGNRNLLYKNNGDGNFTKITDNAISSQSTFTSNAGFADFDNDGDLDLFLTEWGKDNWLFENNGDGSYTKISGTEVNSNKNISISCSWGDYDNDGFLDLFVGNGSTSTTVKQENFLFHNNGNKTFTKITTGDIAGYKGCVWTSAWGDVDNDGDIDLYVGTIYENVELLYINNGDGTFTYKNEFEPSARDIGTGITGASFGDFNNDGFIDLLVADVSKDGRFIYKNNGNTNNWINIECIGKLSNRSAIGARVKIKASVFGKTFWQIREIHGVNGFRGSDDLRVHFGLGDATVIDSLIVTWPSKQTSIQTNIPVNQFLTIEESIPLGYLKANFKTDKHSGYSPLEVKFTDISISNETQPVTSWSWDFDGDGKEDSKEKDPVFVYNIYEGRSYSISLTISNGNASNTITRENYISVTPMFFQNIALAKNTTASSARSNRYTSNYAIDGVGSTRWWSDASDTQWIQIEMDSVYAVGKINLKWGTSYAVQYKILGSKDGSDWFDIKEVDNGKGGTEEHNFNQIRTKYLKITADKSSGGSGYSIYEIEVYRPQVVSVENEIIPQGFYLFQNYPNPFNPSTTIKYSIAPPNLPQGKSLQHVQLKVYDMLGREVATLVNEEKTAGNYEVKFDGTNLSSGIYLYRLIAGEFNAVGKMMLIK